MQFLVNLLISATVIATAAELSRRSSVLASMLISLPLSTIIALCLIYTRSGDTQKAAAFSVEIFWFVVPSLGFLLLFPFLIKQGLSFWLALTASCAAMALTYPAYGWVLKKFGIL